MSLAVGNESIADDELLYRRVPVSQGWYISQKLSPKAFHPLKHDEDGISLWRANKYSSPRQAARGRSRRGYYIAVLRAGDLKARGIECVPTPSEEGIGHVSIPALNYASRRDPQVNEIEVLLATQLTLSVQGPFHTLEVK